MARSRIPLVGYLPSAGTAASASPALQAFRNGLTDLEYAEGRDITIELRWTEGRIDRLPELAADLVRLNVDVLVTYGGVATRAAKNATSTIPVVFAVVIDPVAGGLVPNLERPGGNLTGLTSFDPQEVRPHLEILKEAIPGLTRVAFLGDKGVPGGSSTTWDEEQAGAVGVHVQSLRVQGPDPDLHGAFETARRARAEAVLVLEMPVTVEHRRHIGALATRHRLPALFVGGYGDTDGLIAYGTSRAETGRKTAVYVHKILNGVKPAELPVERVTRRELIINLKTARSIGVTIPPTLLERADRVIE